MANDEPTLRALAQDAITRLAAIRDDLKVRIHLAGMEAADAWKELEPQVETVTSGLKTALDATVVGGSEQARLQLELGVAEASDRLQVIERRFERIGHDVVRDTRESLAALRTKIGKSIAQS